MPVWHMKKVFVLTAIILLALCSLGCSVFMAARQPEKKDLSVFSIGTSRGQVLAELGEPAKTYFDDGRKTDTFLFRQGYSRGAKWGRGLLHATADLFTLGLWEAVGTPIELYADGNELLVDVQYDAGDRVSGVNVLKGASEQKGSASSPPAPVPGPSAPDSGYTAPLTAIWAEREKPNYPDGSPSSDQAVPVTTSWGPEPETTKEVPKMTIGLIAAGGIEALSPDIRLKWLSKTTGVGDWLENARDYKWVFEWVPLVGYLAVGAYTIYLPFAVTTGAVAGEVEAQQWRFCSEEFIAKVKAADFTLAFNQALEKTGTTALSLPMDTGFEEAKLHELSVVVEVGIKGVGLRTCDELGRFSMVTEAAATAYDPANREIRFSETYTRQSPACFKVQAFCNAETTTYVREEIILVADGLAAAVHSKVSQ
jgi:hypothetical protein